MRRFAAVLLILAGLGVALAQAASRLPPLDGLEGRIFEATVLSRLLALNALSTELAAREVRFAQRTQVKEAARRAIAEDSRERQALEPWLAAWLAQDATAQEAARQEASRVRAAFAVVQSDAFGLMTPMQGHEMPIDRAFLEAMIAYRTEAVFVARATLAKKVRPELRAYALEMLEVRSRELEAHRALLQSLR